MSGIVNQTGVRSGTVGRVGGLNFVPTDTEPSTVKGNIYYDASETKLKHHNGSAWKSVNTTTNYDRPGDGPYASDVYTKLLIQSNEA